MSPSSGSGTGHPITPAPAVIGYGSGGTTIIVGEYEALINECSAIKLARYAQLVGYDECPFWGIAPADTNHSCRYVWMLSDRLMAAKYLCEAQHELEQELSYLIGLQWTVEDKKPYKCPMFTKYGYITAFGIEHIDTIQSSAPVNHATDPAVIGPLATTSTDTSEIVVYHPGTEVEITPSSITISGGLVTIRIPRCRMVKLAYVDNPEAGWAYADVATWGETKVDVARRYNDTGTQVVLSTNHKCTVACATAGCTAYTQTACGYVKNPKIGSVEIFPADYSSGTWTKKSCLCSEYDEAQLNYLSGATVTPQLEDMIVRLAHSKMPTEPCGCDPLRNMWERDRKVPDLMTPAQASCKFGTSEGAWTAWLWAQTLKLVRGGIVG